MSFLSRVFGSTPSSKSSEDPKSVQVLLEKLQPLSDEKARELACLAYVLGRIAAADEEITADESSSISALLQERGGLSLDQAALVTEVALGEARHMGGTQDYLVTRQLQTLVSRKRREGNDCLLASADESICSQEESELKAVSRRTRSSWRHSLGIGSIGQARWRLTISVWRSSSENRKKPGMTEGMRWRWCIGMILAACGGSGADTGAPSSETGGPNKDSEQLTLARRMKTLEAEVAIDPGAEVVVGGTLNSYSAKRGTLPQRYSLLRAGHSRQ